ncbi:hypothetical protein Z043_119871 [Scleropages formosus]|uniref:RING-type E3 ubiquitin transferase n=1 Tax=Scleropages formosus TaxID=113540 RepID=A0A0P7WF54_SCLFO|nr:hypothetical protein Z043_119871 [Scleropages formosus]
MDPPSPAAPGSRDERRLQQERLRREEAYYHFINSLSDEEYRLMRDSNLLGTPGEVTAEELRQRLDGAKERLSVQPRSQSNETGEEDGRNGTVGPVGEASNGDSLLEWLNTFRRTGNATRSGQSGNQTWRAVSRTNPNSGEFRFSLEININHEQPESSESLDPPQLLSNSARPSHYSSTRHASNPLARPVQGRRMQARRNRSSPVSALGHQQTVPDHSGPLEQGTLRAVHLLPSVNPQRQRSPEEWVPAQPNSQNTGEELEAAVEPNCPRVSSMPQETLPICEPRSSRTRTRGRGRRVRVVSLSGGHRRASQRSRSPLDRGPAPSTSHADLSAPDVSMAAEQATAEMVPQTPALPVEPVAEELDSQASGTGGSVRRHPTIMLDLQVRRIRPGENRDRDSIASRTRSRVRMAENTVTFESDSGGFRRTISRSERAGVRTYVSTIRIPLRRISETGLGEPSSTALRSILRQIMTGFGELSSLMETEADAEESAPPTQAFRVHGNEGTESQESATRQGVDGEGSGRLEEDHARTGGTQGDGRPTSRDTNNLVENGTLPILRLAHFFLLNDDEDEEHPRGLTKEQIDNLSTRTYGQTSLEGELGRACSVCISEYAQGNKLRRLPCAHEFHIHCIDRWLSENSTCPICRQPVLSVHQA